MPGVRGIGRVCRIFSRGLYRALGTEHIRHRRTASADVLMRRLLSLDYVIEHPDLPWLPTEPEKVAAFEALGIERELLPSRLYRGAAGDTRCYFPLKLPVALDSGRAVFVYVDPGHDTSTALRSWGAAHRGLWHALENQGRSVEVVAVARTSREMDRALAVMSGWAEASGPGESDAGIREELARIERAILQGAVQILEEFGGLQAALKRSVALEKQAHRRCAPLLRCRPRHGNVLRLRGRVGQRRTSSTDRDGSDPPVQGPGTGSEPGVFAHLPPPSWGRSRAIDPSRKGVGPMTPATLAIIGTALGAAAGHAFRAPFPGMGGNPVLDLIAYHDPGLHTVIRVWYYAAGAGSPPGPPRPRTTHPRS